MRFVTYLTTYSGKLLPPKYIGSTSESNAKSGTYFGSVSSKKWKKIFDDEIQNNKKLFSLQILSYHKTRQEAFLEELKLQKLYDVVNSKEYFNEAFASKYFFHGHHHSKETKEKIKEKMKEILRNLSIEKKRKISLRISERLKAAWRKPEIKAKMSFANYLKNKGRKHTEKSKKNMSFAHIGKKQSAETIKKRVVSLKGHKMSEKCKKALLAGRKAHPLTKLSRQQMSKSAKNRKLSEKTRNLMILKMRISKQKPRKFCELISPIGMSLKFHGLKSASNFAKVQGLSFHVLKNWRNKGPIIYTSKKYVQNIGWEFRT